MIGWPGVGHGEAKLVGYPVAGMIRPMSERNQWSQPNQPSENESSNVIWPPDEAASRPSDASPYRGASGSTRQESNYNWDTIGQTTVHSSYTDPGSQVGYDPAQTTSESYQNEPTESGFSDQEAAVGYTASVKTSAGPASRHGQSFLNALLDLSFTRWATPAIAKIGYAITMVFVILNWFFLLLLSIGTGRPLLIIAALLVLPITGVLFLSLVRVLLESAVALIRIVENTAAATSSTEGQ